MEGALPVRSALVAAWTGAREADAARGIEAAPGLDEPPPRGTRATRLEWNESAPVLPLPAQRDRGEKPRFEEPIPVPVLALARSVVLPRQHEASQWRGPGAALKRVERAGGTEEEKRTRITWTVPSEGAGNSKRMLLWISPNEACLAPGERVERNTRETTITTWTIPNEAAAQSALGRAKRVVVEEKQRTKWISPFPTRPTFRVARGAPARAAIHELVGATTNNEWSLVPSAPTKQEGAGAPAWEDRGDGKPSVEATVWDPGLPIVVVEEKQSPETHNRHAARRVIVGTTTTTRDPNSREPNPRPPSPLEEGGTTCPRANPASPVPIDAVCRN